MDFRGLTCLIGATVMVGACTTDVDGNSNFTSGGSSSSSTTAASQGDDTTSSTSSTSGSSSGDATTLPTASSSGTADADGSSSSGSFGSQCGNGTIEFTEDCDCGEDGECTIDELGGNACADVEDPLVPGVLTGGTLRCNQASCRYDTSECGYCGDGDINENETCEPKLPIDTDCQTLGEGTAGTLTCMDSCLIDTTACTECGYSFTFDDPEDCEGDWVTLRTTNAAPTESWECGDTTSYGGGPGVGTTGVWATELDGPYLANESGYVRSGNLELSNCVDKQVLLTVRHWFDFQGGVVNSDGGIVQVTTGDPDQLIAGWETIAPVSGTVYSKGNINATHPPVDNNPGFSGQDPDEGTWVESVFDITAYAGPTLSVRFLLGSNSGGEVGGWYIDEVEILGVPK